jgi:hypothetical protein
MMPAGKTKAMLGLSTMVVIGLVAVRVASGQEAVENHSGPPHDHVHGHDHGHFLLHHGERPTPPPGNPRFIPHTFERAGYPQCLRNHVEPSFVPGVRGYYVGGGAAHGGEGRFPDDGVWGWDDTGCPWLPMRVRLLWSHGRRYQGGPGAYATDGPHVPDPIYGVTSSVNSLRGRLRGFGE